MAQNLFYNSIIFGVKIAFLSKMKNFVVKFFWEAGKIEPLFFGKC